MKTFIIRKDDLNTGYGETNLEAIKNTAARGDILCIITSDGNIPVKSYNVLSTLPCRVCFIEIDENAENTAAAACMARYASSESITFIGVAWSDSLIQIAEQLEITKPGFVTQLKNGDAKKTAAKPRVRSAKKPKTEPIKPEEPAESKTPDTGIETAMLPQASEKFSERLHTYAADVPGIQNKEFLIEQAVRDCMSDVSLDMILRMKLGGEIPGLAEALKPHFKELKEIADRES